MKVTTIEEVQDLANIKVFELISFLHAFEMALNNNLKRRTNLYFLCDTLKRMKIKVENVFPEAIALVGRNFNYSIKKLDKRWRTYVLDKVPDITPLNIRKGMQYYECEGV